DEDKVNKNLFVNKSLSYTDIEADIAWELNLGLPKRYQFIYISPHGVGAAAFMTLLYHCCDIFIRYSWGLTFDSKKRYCFYFQNLCDTKIKNQAINISECHLPCFNKFLFLLDTNKPILFGVRDPIGILKHCVGRDFSYAINTKKELPIEFNLTFDYRCYLDFLRHIKTKINFNFAGLKNTSSFFSQFLSKRINFNTINYIDMSEITPDKAFQTLSNLAKQFSFPAPKKEMEYLCHVQEFKGYLRYLFPLKLYANKKDLENAFSLHNIHNKKHYTIDKENSITLLFCRLTTYNKNTVNLMKEIIYNDLSEHIGICISKKQYDLLQGDEDFFKKLKNYLIEFINEIKKAIDEGEKNLIKEEKLLEILRQNKDEREKLKSFYKDDINCIEGIKQTRPDIIASWKYYNEFEKMCEELDKKA
ncbi:invasion protein, partial [Campylobacter sp. MIT 12-5580]|uniref:DUF2972 domain-containing protein n=1 Tax=Campylobacter sp. MIT 12-5580 TaxID=2040651 RepID=UPI0010F7489A